MNEPARVSLETIDLTTPARRAVAHMVKMRARHYLRRPLALESLHPGLSAAAPATLVAVATYLVERESKSPRRWFGFGGEVSLLNARAALLLGRALRQKASKMEDRSTKAACRAQSIRQEP